MAEGTSKADPRGEGEVRQADRGGKCARQREEPIQRPGHIFPCGKWCVAHCGQNRERGAGQRCHGVDGDGLLGADERVEATSCREGNP